MAERTKATVLKTVSHFSRRPDFSPSSAYESGAKNSGANHAYLS
jgi:hypothetical protein